MLQVSNPYKAAIKSRWDHASSSITTLQTILDGPFAKLQQAWVGGSSEDAYNKLDGLRQRLSADVKTCNTTFQDAYRRQPEMVDEDAWQTRWRLIG